MNRINRPTIHSFTLLRAICDCYVCIWPVIDAHNPNTLSLSLAVLFIVCLAN